MYFYMFYYCSSKDSSLATSTSLQVCTSSTSVVQTRFGTSSLPGVMLQAALALAVSPSPPPRPAGRRLVSESESLALAKSAGDTESLALAACQ